MVEETGQTTSRIKVSIVDIPKIVRQKFTSRMETPSEAKKTQEKAQSYLVMFAAELLGTALLMFFGCMGCVTNYEPEIRPSTLGAVAFGLTVMLIIQLLGHVSGAHLNPAVTIATLLLKTLTPTMALVYVVAQFVGATLGYGLLKIFVSDTYAPEGFCATLLNPNLSVIQGLGIEIVISTVLIMICCAVWDPRNADKTDSVPLRFGLVIVVISLIAGPLTGASMNTARSVAPLVFGGSWANHWIYWVGPTLGAFLGCGIYQFVFGVRIDAKKLEAENIYLEEHTEQQKYGPV